MSSVVSPTDLETIACYVCGEQKHAPWAEENGFKAVRCGECGLVYVNPRPTRSSISLAAQTGLHAGKAIVDETGARDRRKVHSYRKKIRALYDRRALTSKPGARWFDIGCGFGELLEALQQESEGALVGVGSEPNERKALAARARGHDVFFRDIAAEPPGYDFVSLLNVFSHLPDPPDFLRQVASLLVPGGELVLQTGNWAELEREAIPDRLHLPDHLSFASERLVRRVLEAAGLSVISVLRYPMFRPHLWAQLGGKTPAPGGACDLWFRARMRGGAR